VITPQAMPFPELPPAVEIRHVAVVVALRIEKTVLFCGED
jgi:hypothetical protein